MSGGLGILAINLLWIHRDLLGQRGIFRYKKNVTLRWIFTVIGRFEGCGLYVLGAENAQQMPNKSLRSNACNAAPGNTLAKCENPQCLRHFGEHWLILCPWSLTKSGQMFPVV